MKIEVCACDFCRKTEHQVKQLIAGPKIMICNECVDICNEIIAKALAEKPAANIETPEAPCGK